MKRLFLLVAIFCFFSTSYIQNSNAYVNKYKGKKFAVKFKPKNNSQRTLANTTKANQTLAKPVAKNTSIAQKNLSGNIVRKYSELLINSDTGKVIKSTRAEELRYPASLTKMMTIYLAFEQIKYGKMHFNKQLYVSRHAASMPRTNLALKGGSYITLKEALMGLVVHSANDAAVVLAENIGGNESRFAELMTKRAKQLGMNNTSFKNASGLHNPNQYTTAKDMAILGIALKKHYPQYYGMFSQTTFKYKGVTYTSHNNVTKQFKGVDGIKTGFVNASGFNLVSSARTKSGNLIGVILGGRTAYTRDARMKAMLNEGIYQLALEKNGTQKRYASNHINANALTKK
jgi:D-alanyl-D-alanine carboxypeptidase